MFKFGQKEVAAKDFYKQRQIIFYNRCKQGGGFW